MKPLRVPPSAAAKLAEVFARSRKESGAVGGQLSLACEMSRQILDVVAVALEERDLRIEELASRIAALEKL